MLNSMESIFFSLGIWIMKYQGDELKIQRGDHGNFFKLFQKIFFLHLWFIYLILHAEFNGINIFLIRSLDHEIPRGELKLQRRNSLDFFPKIAKFFLPHLGFIYLVLHAEFYYRFVLFHSGMDFYNIFSKLIFKIL